MKPDEIALSIIENAGFRDSRVIPARVVQQMLAQVIADSHQKQQRMFDLLEKVPCHEPWPWDRLGLAKNEVTLKSMDAGLIHRQTGKTSTNIAIREAFKLKEGSE